MAWIEGEDLPPPDVTRELFLEWRAARRGAAHPERQTNPLWTWLARRSEITAYRVRRHFGLDEQPRDAGWTNQRYGQSRTPLPDGRVVAIAGEHEDFYDPDFYIYNDVLVTSPDGAIELYGYPPEAFPPTDFHSATLVGEHIVVVGNVGYGPQRGPQIPIYSLDTRSFTFAKIEAGGADPGWLSQHRAELSVDGRRLTVRGGRREVRHDGRVRLRENPDAYTLDLDARVWTRDTTLPWSIWELGPAEGHHARLYQIGWMADHAARDDDFDRRRYAELEADLGRTPDLALYRLRYSPPLAHERLPRGDEEWDTTRVAIEGVTVRYTEGTGAVRITFEGRLSGEGVAAVVEDARRKLEAIEACPYVATCLDDWAPTGTGG